MWHIKHTTFWGNQKYSFWVRSRMLRMAYSINTLPRAEQEYSPWHKARMLPLEECKKTTHHGGHSMSLLARSES